MFDLYISETCPYCQKVMNYLERNNIKYDKKNVQSLYFPNAMTFEYLSKNHGQHKYPESIHDGSCLL